MEVLREVLQFRKYIIKTDLKNIQYIVCGVVV